MARAAARVGSFDRPEDGHESPSDVVGAVWHSEPLVALGAAKVLAASGEDWARDLVEDSLLDEETKAKLVSR